MRCRSLPALPSSKGLTAVPPSSPAPRRILLELDPSDDPVWIFFDTQHRHILQLLRTTAEASMSRIHLAMDQHGEADENDRRQAADLRACVDSLETLEGERVRGAYPCFAPPPLS